MAAKINNVSYQFADLELALSDSEGAPLAISDAFRELNYSDNVEREKMRGASQVPIDSTDGEYDAEGSAVFYRKFFDYIVAWCAEKGIGFYDAEFTLTVNYRKKGEAVTTDTIKKVKFASRDNSHSQGPDALVVSCDLFIGDRIFFAGKGPFGETL
jgi:hypothetical protein